MLSVIKSMSLQGLDGYLVEVQVDVGQGLPYWEVVGLPDTTVRESKERVKTAIKNSKIDLASRRIIINLAPASTKKEGSFFDLPIAVGILSAYEEIQNNNLSDYIFIGELSLNGKLNKVNGVLPMCIEATRLGIKKVIVPRENAQEAAVVKGIEVIPANNLNEVVNYLNKKIDIKPYTIDIEKFFQKQRKQDLNFSEVKGQEDIKRALEISAAGGHNCLMIGSPRVAEKP